MINMKEPKSFDEQISILKSRGLVIKNEIEAKLILSNINYYRFSAYLLTFKYDEDTYVEGASFEQVYEIYKFDRDLRNLLIDLIGNIEISRKK